MQLRICFRLNKKSHSNIAEILGETIHNRSTLTGNITKENGSKYTLAYMLPPKSVLLLLIL